MPNPVELRAAFLEGYTSLRPSPEVYAGQFDTFIAARQLDTINFALRSNNPADRAHLDAMLARGEARLRAWLGRETGAH